MLRPLVSLAAFAMAAALPSLASAAPAQVTGNVNLRTGPGTQYYAITTLPAGLPVEVYGCLRGYTWCDVSDGRDRGWVSSRYLSTFYAGPTYRPAPRRPLPHVTFSFGYWDNHYANRSWYQHRPRPDMPPRDSHGWAGGPGMPPGGPGRDGPRCPPDMPDCRP